MSARDGYCCQGSENTYVVACAICAPGIEARKIAISDNRRYAADVAIACGCFRPLNLSSRIALARKTRLLIVPAAQPPIELPRRKTVGNSNQEERFSLAGGQPFESVGDALSSR
jgi:hypothetical protein